MFLGTPKKEMVPQRWHSGKESRCRRHGFDPQVGKISCRRKWQPTPVLLPGEFHGLRRLVGYSPRSRKESDTTEQLHFHFHPKYTHAYVCVNVYLHMDGGISSVQFSCSVVSDSLQSHESQHARPPCPSPSPGVYSDSCPSSR